MRTIKPKVYSFDELTDEAKQTVISENYDINVTYYWWDGVYYDAAQIGLKITGFDIGRGSYCNAKLAYRKDRKDIEDVANAIISEHGVGCETYKMAKQYLVDYDSLVSEYSDGVTLNVVADEKEYDFERAADKLEEEFLNSLCDCYLTLLRNQYEYLCSEEAIINTIRDNEYEFTEDGRRF